MTFNTWVLGARLQSPGAAATPMPRRPHVDGLEPLARHADTLEGTVLVMRLLEVFG